MTRAYGHPEIPSPIAELIETRPEAFDFGDSPDIKPLDATYIAQMNAMRPTWTHDVRTTDETEA